jgi:hypothetical protein
MREFYSKENFLKAGNENTPKKRQKISKLEKKDSSFRITVEYMKKGTGEGWRFFDRYLNIKAKDAAEARKKTQVYLDNATKLNDEVAHTIRKIEQLK